MRGGGVSGKEGIGPGRDRLGYCYLVIVCGGKGGARRGIETMNVSFFALGFRSIYSPSVDF